MARIRSWGIILLAQLCLAAPALAQLDVEPNNACAVPQDAGAFTGAARIDGVLGNPDVDFFRFSAQPGLRLTAEVVAFGPMLGVFDSLCGLLQVRGELERVSADFVVPADGILVVAVSSALDSAFQGAGIFPGPYTLRLFPQPPPIGSISGRAVDAVSRQPLSGESPTSAEVSLFRCRGDDCFEQVGARRLGADGRFRFDSDFVGTPLLVGRYKVEIFAPEFPTAARGPFDVGAAQNLDLGDIALTPPPIRLADIRPCVIPAGGGVCRYSVALQNNTTTTLRGTAWSVVDASGLFDGVFRSLFEASAMRGTDTVRRISVAVPARRSRVLTFQFDVPASVPSGTSFCTQVFFGPDPSPLVHPSRQSSLFCVEKQ